jgi:hypothetical protein
MDFIFEHEQLRIDEIARKINVKNSFKPLKPLKSFRLSRRRNTIERENKFSNFSASSKRKYDDRSLSPNLQKFMEIDWKQRSMIDFTNPCTTQSDRQENDSIVRSEFRYLGKKTLPDIRKNRFVQGKELGKKDLKKTHHNLIAFIPTVSYLNSC